MILTSVSTEPLLEWVDDKCLGMIIDETLSFKQIDLVFQKISYVS